MGEFFDHIIVIIRHYFFKFTRKYAFSIHEYNILFYFTSSQFKVRVCFLQYK